MRSTPGDARASTGRDLHDPQNATLRVRDRLCSICPTPARLAERNEHRMGIADLVVTTAKVRKGPPCSVCALLKSLPPDEHAAFLRLLSDPDVRYTELASSLRGEGYDFADSTLSRHARGRCEARTKLRSA